MPKLDVKALKKRFEELDEDEQATIREALGIESGSDDAGDAVPLLKKISRQLDKLLSRDADEPGKKKAGIFDF